MESESKLKSLKSELNLKTQEVESKQKVLNAYGTLNAFPVVTQNIAPESRKFYECKRCKGKFFVSKEYLRSHYKRRHPGVPEIFNDEPIIARDPFKSETETPIQRRSVIQKNEQQAEELKNIQEKLQTLTQQVILANAAKEASKENTSDNLKSEREISNLNEKIDKLTKTISEIQNQLPSKYETHGVLTDRVIKTDRGTEPRNMEIIDISTPTKQPPSIKPSNPIEPALIEPVIKPRIETNAVKMPPEAVQNKNVTTIPAPQQYPMTVTERTYQSPERAIEKKNQPVTERLDSVHDFSEPRRSIIEDTSKKSVHEDSHKKSVHEDTHKKSAHEEPPKKSIHEEPVPPQQIKAEEPEVAEKAGKRVETDRDEQKRDPGYQSQSIISRTMTREFEYQGHSGIHTKTLYFLFDAFFQ